MLGYSYAVTQRTRRALRRSLRSICDGKIAKRTDRAIGIAQKEESMSTKVSGTVRAWHPDQGWGIFDSESTPGGCWASASEMLPMADSPILQQGSAVRFDWTDISHKPISGYRFRAHSFYPIDEALDLDEEDYELLELEEPDVDADDTPTESQPARIPLHDVDKRPSDSAEPEPSLAERCKAITAFASGVIRRRRKML